VNPLNPLSALKRSRKINVGKLVILIPAFNEANNIRRTINLVKRTGVNGQIVVINDGSTDKTSQIARENGCHVIDLPKNVGKANAFFAGVKEAINRDVNAAILLDSDAVKVSKKGLVKMASQARRATLNGESRMVVALTHEKTMRQQTSAFSGIRAFSKQALHQIKRSRAKKAVEGFGLEIFLGKLFLKRTSWITKSGFKNQKPIRRGETAVNQIVDIFRTHVKMGNRRKKMHLR